MVEPTQAFLEQALEAALVVRAVIFTDNCSKGESPVCRTAAQPPGWVMSGFFAWFRSASPHARGKGSPEPNQGRSLS